MQTTPTRTAEADLILLAITGAWITLEAAATLTLGLIALVVTLTGWRPAVPVPTPLPVVITPAPVALPPAPAAPLERLTVVQLRARARAAGLPQLARAGRRADLLAALVA